MERDLSRAQLAAEGLSEDIVEETIRLVDRAEYKRRQAPPGIRITSRAFGRDRRLPITNASTAELDQAGAGRTAIVTRARAQSGPRHRSGRSPRPTSCAHDAAPGRRVTRPDLTGRRKLAWLAWPIATIPSPATAS